MGKSLAHRSSLLLHAIAIAFHHRDQRDLPEAQAHEYSCVHSAIDMSSMPDEFKLLRVSLQWLPWSARPSSGCFFPCPPATSGFPRMGDFPVDPAERASSPQSEAASGVAEGEESENASERLSGNAVDLRRALVRKVAQLTKVVMHLTSLNDADEKQYEELQAELECEVQLVMEKALKEMDAERHKLTELADKTCLQEGQRDGNMGKWQPALLHSHFQVHGPCENLKAKKSILLH